jgi:hypothetical protein
LLISSTACAGGLIQFKDILPNNSEKAAGSFGDRYGRSRAVELACTAFDTTSLIGQQRLFITEHQNSVRTDFYTDPTP